MDTAAFLLERQKLVGELEAHRDNALRTKRERKPSLLEGLPFGDLSSLLFSLGQGAGFASWLPKILMTTVAPFLFSVVEKKVRSVMQRKPMFSRILDLLPFSRFKL